MTTLTNCILQHKTRIKEALHIGYANWDNLVARIKRQERNHLPDFYDEKVWTFLVSCVYAIQGPPGIGLLAQLLTEANVPPHSATKAWFEVLPLPPRFKEGNTHLDFALGNIELRNGTRSGIEFGGHEQSWICFVECKWYSDIAGFVSHDKQRNQFARVIENAIYFKCGDQLPQQVHVTLVTPEVFKSYKTRSRLYQYKFIEYSQADETPETLVRDLDASSLQLRGPYNNIHERLNNLHLHWISYETLFNNAPDSELKQPFCEFVKLFNGTQQEQSRNSEG
jgi:hypothetical protein